MPLPGNHDGDAAGLVGEAQTPVHVQLRGQTGETLPEVETVNAQTFHEELDALKEDASLVIGVLIGVDNVPSQLPDEVRHSGHQPLLVQTRQEESGSQGGRSNVRAARHEVTLTGTLQPGRPFPRAAWVPDRLPGCTATV